MKKVLLLSGVLAAVSGISQTFTVNDTLGLGMSTNYFVMDSNAVNYNAVIGTGVTWDYSALTAYEDATLLNVVTASSSVDFPAADYNDDLSTGASIYFSNMPDSMMVYGYIFEAGGNDVLVKHNSDPMKALEFPMAVGDTYTDLIEGQAVIQTFTFASEGTATVTLDGFGTLLVSGNTHTNVVRVKLVEELTATITFPVTTTGTVTRTIYSYYDLANDKQAIFVHATIDVASSVLNDNYSAVYYGGTPMNYLSTNGAKANNTFSVYPNPANTLLTITTDGTAEALNIFNAAGQVVASVNNPTATETIDIATLPAGIYVIQVTKDGLVTQDKVVVE